MDRANQLLQDANYIETKALSNGAGNTATDAIDLGALSDRGAHLASCELLIEAPALNTTQLPDGETMTYSVESDDNSGFSSATVVADKLILQTGSGGTGASAAEARFKIPSDCEQYIRVKATKTGTGDCSSLEMTVSLRF